MSAYTLRKINLDTDMAVMTKLISHNLKTGDELARQSIEWSYNKNPVENASGIALLSEGSEVVGLINQSYRHFFIHNKRSKIVVFGDLVVDDKHRSLMPAIMLIREALKDSLEKTPLVYSFPNKKSANVALRAGLILLGKMTRYVYIVSYYEYLSKKISLPVIIKPLFKILNLIPGIAYRIKNNKTYSKYQAVFQNISNTELEIISKQSFLNKYILAHRTENFINWRYNNNPFSNFETIKCLTRDTNTCSGYVILERSSALLHIRDIYSSDIDSFRALLIFAIDRARELSIPGLSISFLGNSTLSAVILKSGFVKRESDRSVVIKPLDNHEIEYYANHNNWYILDGDEDH